jgi:hypothetical protein
MATPLFSRKKVLLAKLEGTPGTAETLAGSDGAFNAFDADVVPDIQMTERLKQGGADRLKAIRGALMGRATVRFELAGSGATGAVPAWASAFFPACGYIESTTTFTRTLDQTSQQSLTIGIYRDGLRQLLSGAVGTFRIVVRNGQVSDIVFDMIGKYSSETDVALPTPTYPTVLPPRGYESFTLASYSPDTPEITIEAGGNPQLIAAANDSNNTGYSRGYIVDYNATLRFAPEAEVAANRDWHSIFSTPTTEALSLVVGDVANNIVTIAATDAQVISHPFGNRDGRDTRDVTLSLLSGFTVDFG